MKIHRPVRSFVLRQGRLTGAQQRALSELWPRYGLEFTGKPRDFDELFGRKAQRVLEIGFGNGEALCWAAQREPERDFIGVEVHRPGVGRLLNDLAAAELDNVRIYCHDAVEVLREEIAPASLHEIRIWFPDPWPKARHHKRRLIQPAFAALLADKLCSGGLLHLATDWQNYALWMQETLSAEPRFKARLSSGDSGGRPPWRLETHFERRGLRLGHSVWDLLYERV